MTRIRVATLALTAALTATLGSAAPAGAQSLFGARGLGLPVAGVDARAHALGGIGTGTLGLTTALVNPADAAGVRRRGVVAVYQPVSERVGLAGQEDDRSASRFPLIGILYPVGERVVVSAGWSTFLDQNWGIATERTERLRERDVAVRDELRSTGGISQVRLGASYALGESLALGVAGGLYTGEVQRTLAREFEDGAEIGLRNFRQLSIWEYRAPFVTAGLRWDPTGILRVAGAVTWAGEVDASTDNESLQEFGVSAPLQATGGVSALLGPQLMATVGGRWAGWSDASGDPLGWDLSGVGVQASDSWQVGGGLEWMESANRGRSWPVRIGAQYAKLPFLVEGHQPTEWSASVGLGVRLNQTEIGPGALLDVALERGARGDEATTRLTEEFWRLTLSLSLFGR